MNEEAGAAIMQALANRLMKGGASSTTTSTRQTAAPHSLNQSVASNSTMTAGSPGFMSNPVSSFAPNVKDTAVSSHAASARTGPSLLGSPHQLALAREMQNDTLLSGGKAGETVRKRAVQAAPTLIQLPRQKIAAAHFTVPSPAHASVRANGAMANGTNDVGSSKKLEMANSKDRAGQTAPDVKIATVTGSKSAQDSDVDMFSDVSVVTQIPLRHGKRKSRSSTPTHQIANKTSTSDNSDGRMAQVLEIQASVETQAAKMEKLQTTVLADLAAHAAKVEELEHTVAKLMQELTASKQEMEMMKTTAEDDKFFLFQAITHLQECEEKRQTLGTANSAFGVTIKFRNVSVKVQARAAMTVTDLVRRARAAADVTPHQTPNPRLSSQGVQIGHLTTLGEAGIMQDSELVMECHSEEDEEL